MQTEKSKNIRVFLGGTVDGYKWRNDLITLLECNYYNPIVKDWAEEDRLRDVKERDNDDYVLYVITGGMAGVYSIAEIIDDSNKRPKKTLICFLYDTFKNKKMLYSLKATEKLAITNGVTSFKSLNEIADFLNSVKKERNNE